MHFTKLAIGTSIIAVTSSAAQLGMSQTQSYEQVSNMTVSAIVNDFRYNGDVTVLRGLIDIAFAALQSEAALVASCLQSSSSSTGGSNTPATPAPTSSSILNPVMPNPPPLSVPVPVPAGPPQAPPAGQPAAPANMIPTGQPPIAAPPASSAPPPAPVLPATAAPPVGNNAQPPSSPSGGNNAQTSAPMTNPGSSGFLTSLIPNSRPSLNGSMSLSSNLSGLLNSAGGQGSSITAGGNNALGGLLSSAGSAATGALGGVANGLPTPLAGLVSGVNSVAGGALSGVGGLVSGILGGSTATPAAGAGGLVSNAAGAAGGLLSGVGAAATGALGGVASALPGPLGGVVSGVNSLAGGVLSGAGGALSNLGGAAGSLPTAVGGAVSNVGAGAAGALTGAGGAITGAVGNVAGALPTPLGGLVSGVGNAAGGAVSAAGAAVSGVAGGLGGAAGGLLGGGALPLSITGTPSPVSGVVVSATNGAVATCTDLICLQASLPGLLGLNVNAIPTGGSGGSLLNVGVKILGGGNAPAAAPAVTTNINAIISAASQVSSVVGASQCNNLICLQASLPGVISLSAGAIPTTGANLGNLLGVGLNLFGGGQAPTIATVAAGTGSALVAAVTTSVSITPTSVAGQPAPTGQWIPVTSWMYIAPGGSGSGSGLLGGLH
ncbi:hypothetical protein E4T44_03924 [Aureobasidium sp. EXF-8845]|nr:hypothetical protein E4T44_03924 [Aureobasidium sp. EXF-8845]KAI4854697.1 hypothetical protein E4T45_03877 [Aureobasidium sp. EXF-8846]